MLNFSRISEAIFIVLSLLVYSGGILNLIISGGANENDFASYDSSLIRLCYLVIYLITFSLILLRWKKVVCLIRKDISILILIGISILSLLWSFEPSSTLQSSITLIGSSALGFYIAANYSLEQQLRLLGVTFSTIAVLSLLFGLALPQYGIMGGNLAGTWRGIYIHKNILGAWMLYGILIFLILSRNVKKWRFVLFIFIGLSILILLLSKSISSLVSLFLVLFLYKYFEIFRSRFNFIVLSLISIILTSSALLIFLVENASAILEAFGKDMTLTGRTDIWTSVMDMIWRHPWLGYGYGGFWHGLEGESAYIWKASGWFPAHPHNGFLGIWLDLGLLGVSVFLIGLLRNFYKSIKLVRTLKSPEALWPLIFLSSLIIGNLTETRLLESNSLYWILYVTIALSL